VLGEKALSIHLYLSIYLHMVVSRCRDIGPPSGFPSSGLCFCWPPLRYCLISLYLSISLSLSAQWLRFARHAAVGVGHTPTTSSMCAYTPDLAFTRYSYTPKRSCTNLFHPISTPPHPTCIFHTITKRLHDYRAIYDALLTPHPFCMAYAIQYR